MAESEKNMPFALEAEQSVLGSILIDPEKFTEVTELIGPDDFYLSEHAEIFSAMRDLFSENREIDLVTLIDMLVKRGVYNEEESKKYIKIIAQIVPSAANVRDYARIVKDKSTLRALINAAEEIREEAFTEQGDIQHLVDSAEQKIFNVSHGNETKSFVTLGDAIRQTYARLDLITKNKKAATGIPTGYEGLDKTIVGLGPGDLVILGARPGMGKTSFCLNIGTNVAKQTGKAVAIFSLEMSAEQLVNRVISSEALIDSYALRTGELKPEQWDHIAQAASTLSGCDILIDDTPGITVSAMKAKLRRVSNLGLVVIDYLQLMQSDKKIENRTQEVSDMSRALKIMAKELNVPVICCSQLSRGTEAQANKRPMMSHLRESGSIEQDADIIIFLYRDDYYKSAEGDTVSADTEQNVAEIIVAKNRHGSTDTVKVGWTGRYTKFRDIALEENTPH